MKVESVEGWERILQGLFPQDAARRILGRLQHYKTDGHNVGEDIRQLANALTAYQDMGRDGK